MRLLILTQKIDQEDDVLGFFHDWVKNLASRFETIKVVCLTRGAYDLPANVQVFSLGKEKNPSRLVYLKNFFGLLQRLEGEYDAVFVHMNQEYVLLGGPWWRLRGRPVLLWRNHPHGTILTRLAVLLANRVFCTSPFSFTARFKKTMLMPAGIDTEKFKPDPAQTKIRNSLLFLSRIAPIKRPDLLIKALAILKEQNQDWRVNFYGNALPRDQEYFTTIKLLVGKFGLQPIVTFHSAIPNYEAPAIYNAHEIFINLTPSGSLDKTILEAAACGLVPIVTNQSFAGVFDQKMLASDDPADVARKITYWLAASPALKKEWQTKLRAYVLAEHSLNALIEKLCTALEKSVS